MASAMIILFRDGLAACLRGAAWFAASLLLAAGPAAHSASFTIDPLKVELGAGQSSAVMRVQNIGSDMLTLQLQAKRWVQDPNGDRLEATRELIATPQIFRIKPGSQQIVRIAMMGKVDPSRELSFRLVFDEIPAPVAADFNGVQVATRVTIPLFVRSNDTVSPRLGIAVKDNGGGKLGIVVSNGGNAHAHIRKFIVSARDDEQKSPLEIDAPAYLLPGSTREFAIPAPGGAAGWGQHLSIKAINVKGSVEFDGPASP